MCSMCTAEIKAYSTLDTWLATKNDASKHNCNNNSICYDKLLLKMTFVENL